MNTLNKSNTPNIPIRVFFDVASPLTLANLIADIEAVGCIDRLETTLAQIAREELVRCIGARDAKRLIDERMGAEQ